VRGAALAAPGLPSEGVLPLFNASVKLVALYTEVKILTRVTRGIVCVVEVPSSARTRECSTFLPAGQSLRCGLSAPPTASRLDPSGGMAIENTLLLSYYGQRFHNPVGEGLPTTRSVTRTLGFWMLWRSLATGIKHSS